MTMIIVSALCLVAVLPVLWLTICKKIKYMHGVFIVAACLLAAFLALLPVRGQDGSINQVIDAQFEQITARVIAMPQQMWDEALSNGASEEQIAQLREQLIAGLVAAKGIYSVLFPSLLMLTMLLMSFLLFRFAKLIQKLFRRDVSWSTSFGNFQLPRSVPWVFILFFAGRSFAPQPYADVCNNLCFLILVVSAACGLSVVDFYLRKKIRYSMLRILIYVASWFLMSILSILGVYLLLFIAMFDAFRDVRGLRKEGTADGE